MSQLVVTAYAGYKANERPCSFTLGKQRHDIGSVLHRWYEPGFMYFKVMTTDRKTYVLRYEDVPVDLWTLTTQFDGEQLLNDSQ